jgi:hypothetical protein
LIVLAVLAVVVFVVTAPLSRPRGSAPSGAAEVEAAEIAELEAAREAKYREIRDAELDQRTGKLSDADYAAIDRALRAEAIEILRSLDRLKGANTPARRE